MKTAVAIGLGVAALLGSAAARADWLVTRDGGRVETQGPWKVDGKRVVFTLKDGTLSSLRLAEVDLDASREATKAMVEEAAAAKASATEAAPAKKSTRVFTDKDFPHPTAPPAPPKDDAGDAKPAPATAAPSLVKVVDWKQSHNQDTNALEITGSVRNTGPELAVAIAVVVRLFNPRGEQFAMQPATLDTRALHPNQNTAFTAVFPDVIDFTTAKFDVQSSTLLLKSPPPAPGDAPADGQAPPPPPPPPQ
ncbi:MAG: hypothetical protein WAM82_20855 [Thermoanaerobaculia bacterium]